MLIKKIAQTLTLTLLSLTLIACNDSQERKQNNSSHSKTPSTKQTTSNKRGNMVSFYDNQFSILKPKAWRIMNDLNEEADMQMGNLKQEAYAIVLTESKIDFDDASLQAYSDLTRGFLSESLKKYKESAPDHFTIQSHPAIKYTLTGNISFLKLKYWHVSIETKDHFHQIVVWSLNSKFEDNKAIYQKVIHSFKIN